MKINSSELTKVMLTLGYSYGDINDVLSDAKKKTKLSEVFSKIVNIIANDTSTFNKFSTKATSLKEDVLSEKHEKKLKNDISSLKRIGWKLDRITKKLITSTEYDMKLTSDLISGIYSSTDAKGFPKPPKAIKKKKEKPYKWPKRPTTSQKTNRQHADNYVAQAMLDPYGSVDTTYSELHQLLNTAGYTKRVIDDLLKGMDLHPPRAARKLAKKQPRKG